MADLTGNGSGEPANHWFAIAPNDSVNLAVVPRALLVGVAGNIAVVGVDGVEAILPVPVGYNPIRPIRVKSTGTTATGIFGLY